MRQARAVPLAADPGEQSGRHYRLRCRVCGRAFDDDGVVLTCAGRHRPGLLVTDYDDDRLEADEQAEGIFRYWRWLPVRDCPDGTQTRTLTYRSPALSRLTGLPNLWISFNGYWPERGATLPTGTFKDLEARAVLARLPAKHRASTLVLASAGNTAAAFARACSDLRQPCLIIVPRSGLGDLRFAGELGPSVTVVALTGGADYSDAIALADRVADHPGAEFLATGGASNVARRDGVGTVLLAAVERIGRIPDYYVQAVGSGAGGIAAYEAALRLVADGRFGSGLPRLVLGQNLPYAPMVDSWRTGRRGLQVDTEHGRRQIQQISAPVLSSRHPAYSLAGGVFDALTATGGDMLAVTNAEAVAARGLVDEVEGIDLDPAASVAAAALLRAVREGPPARDAVVLLNLSGGGRRRRLRDDALRAVVPALEIARADIPHPETVLRIAELTG